MATTVPMSEAQWQKRITDYCDLLNLMWHHETDSRKSKRGFPDLVIVGPYGVLFLELKRQKGKATAEQVRWIKAINDAAGRAAIVRPHDWPVVKRMLDGIAGRDRFTL